MNKFTWQKIMNPITLVVALAQAATGFVFLGTGNSGVADAHIVIGIILVCLILLHLVLNWSWIVMTYFRRSPAQPSQAGNVGVKTA